ncbi:MAG TPA: dihydrolipoamide acetyltransferase family protein [Candidatus Dormibacteraeota bacterium]|nr:dihydrolipoamide acetyltransferase family protein [Candidatus Dormibacteraeota bacterium]
MSRYEFRLPDIGEGLAEAEVGKWLVKVGDQVVEDQPVVEMMTDKAAVEIPAPGAGVVVEQRVEEGAVVKIGAVLYVLETEARIGAAAGRVDERPGAEAPVAAAAQPEARVLAPPAVRKLARELGVDLMHVRGSGPGGRISAEDVKQHAAAPAVAPAPGAPGPPGERVALRGVRRRMAETMADSSRTIAHVTGFHELDAGEFQKAYRRLRTEAESAGRRFPFDTLLVRAVALALARHPIFNASLDVDRMEIVVHPRANIGVATATPDGLIVPVVADAGALSMDKLAAEVDRISAAAREGRASVSDLRGGTFTISNTGAWRGAHGTSLIRPPEVALVAFGRIEDRAVVRDGQVVVRPMMPMSVTFDHRVIDGEQGLTFALTLRELIENPEHLL